VLYIAFDRPTAVGYSGVVLEFTVLGCSTKPKRKLNARKPIPLTVAALFLKFATSLHASWSLRIRRNPLSSKLRVQKSEGGLIYTLVNLFFTNNWYHEKIKINKNKIKLEIWGRAQRKAARGGGALACLGQFIVRVKIWGVSTPYGPKYSLSKKCNLGGSTCAPITFLFVDQSSSSFFLPNVGRVVVDELLFRFSIRGSVTEIFAIEVDSCLKLGRILDVFCPPKF